MDGTKFFDTKASNSQNHLFSRNNPSCC